MPDFKTFFDSNYIGHWDIPKDTVVTIEGCELTELRNKDGQGTQKKLILKIKGAEKPFLCNVTNATTISELYGRDVDKWIGQRVTLFSTTASFGGKQCECIRVRQQKPATKPAAQPEKVSA